MKTRLLFLLSIIYVFFASLAKAQSCDCFINVDSTFTIVPLTAGPHRGQSPLYQCGECSSQAIPLPFSFCFYGKSYDTVYINNKGTISFHEPVYNFPSNGFPAGPDTMVLAPLWADVYDSLTPGEVYYKITRHHLIVQWNTVGYQTFDCDLYDNFQVIMTDGSDTVLPAGNNVSFCYWLMKWESGDSSGGSGGFFGVPAMVGLNEGDGIHYAQFGLFAARNYYYYAPYDSSDGLYWIDNRSFIFNSCVSNDTIGPVIVNPDSCHTFTVCDSDTLSFSALFINPERKQKSKLSASAPGLSGVTVDTVTHNGIDSITVHLIAALADTGTHIITVTATSNNVPPITNSREFTVTIKKCNDTTSGAGIRNITMENNLTVYPNPNNGKFTIGITNYVEGTNIEIDNVLGEQVHTSQLTTHSSQFVIDLSAQPGGVYFIKLFSGNSLIGVGKIVKQ